MAIVDQHRASVRVLYDRYMKTLRDRDAHTQKVLFPEVVQFPPSYVSSIETVLKELRTLGFEITDLGGGSYSVEGMPAGLGGLDATALVSDLVSEAYEQGLGATEQIHSILAETLAQRAAVPYGEVLDEKGMETLVESLVQSESCGYTPDGKKVIATLSDADIERFF